MVPFAKLTVCPFYGRHNCLSEQVIRITVGRLHTTPTLIYNTQPQRCRTMSTEEAFAVVERSIEVNQI